MPDPVFLTHTIKRMFPRRLALIGRAETVSELLTAIRQHFSDHEWGFIDQPLKKAFGGLG